MKAANLIKEIEKRGGTAKLVSEEVTRWNGNKDTAYHVEAELNGYDVHMFGQECTFFTTRRISQRSYYDPTADYNSGNWTFCHRIKDLDWVIR